MRESKITRPLTAALLSTLWALQMPFLPPAARAQDPAGAPEVPVFEAQAAAVVVDVVVRDKKGKLVRDLKATDFTVFEDGEAQTIESLRVVDTALRADEAATAASSPAAPGSGAGVSAGAAPPQEATPSAASVIAFVFDRLTPNARKTAEKAALSYTDRGYVEGDLVAVFSIDLALRTLQPFTNDVVAIRAALARAATQGNTAFASDRDEARERTTAMMLAGDSLDSLNASGDRNAAALVAAQQAFDRVQVNMLRAFDSLERDQQGYATTNGLLAVVTGLKALPGRKTVVFFSEGLALTTNVLAQFRSVISSANRANVSVYAIDAGGLRTESGLREAQEELKQSVQLRASQEGAGDTAMSGGALTRTMERNEDFLRLNPESGLGQLADQTGGFLVRDTNDTTPGFRRIQEDMRFHYLVSYSPTNMAFDGRYRTIGVKVSRPGVTVQTRKGYFAVRPDYTLPVRNYEAPALAFLDKSPRPAAFPVKLGALSFPERDRPGLVPVLVEIPGNTMSWAPERTGGGSHANFAVVVRIKDAQGREADRLSQEYALRAPQDKVPQARAGAVLFYREAELAPGRYTAEAVVYDAVAQTASTSIATFEVPKAVPEGLRLSSLMVVSRAEKLTKEEQTGKNPLHYGEVMLYPNLGTPVRKSVAPVLGFYFSVYGKGAAATGQRATLEIQQGSTVMKKVTTEFGALDPQGRSQNAGALPVGTLAPGNYTLKVSVPDGQGVQTREAPFTVAE